MKIAFIFIFTTLSIQLSAQQLLTSSGGTASLKNVNMSWSLGEILISTGTSQNFTLTQGQQQPFFKGDVIGLDSISIFNALTTDGNTANRFFKIMPIDRYPNNRLVVFNRWGEVIYQTDGYTNNFEARKDGKALETGTYYFYFLPDKSSSKTCKNCKGFIYIINN